MAIGWLSILKNVPWSDVISNAPKVADGAKKLWNATANKPAGQKAAAPGASSGSPADPQALAALAARVATLEATTAELHEQMRASSELITALAEQNAQLIKRLEVNRRRVLGLAAITVALVVVALVGMANWAGFA
jgi:protein-tyrosine-phosphatase